MFIIDGHVDQLWGGGGRCGDCSGVDTWAGSISKGRRKGTTLAKGVHDGAEVIRMMLRIEQNKFQDEVRGDDRGKRDIEAEVMVGFEVQLIWSECKNTCDK